MAALEVAPFATSPRPWRYPSIRATETQDALIALVNVPYGETTGSLRPLGLAALGAFLMAHGINATGFDFSDSRREPEDLASISGSPSFRWGPIVLQLQRHQSLQIGSRHQATSAELPDYCGRAARLCYSHDHMQGASRNRYSCPQ